MNIYKNILYLLLVGFTLPFCTNPDACNFGAYEENDNTIIFDAIVYDSADPYTKYPYVSEMLV